MVKTKNIIEYGDFQTPIELAKEVTSIVIDSVGKMSSVIEPTCGTGTFLKAYLQLDKTATKLVGWEINPSYVQLAKNEFSHLLKKKVSIIEQDFFKINWKTINDEHSEAILFIGNPPWVTSSELGKFQSKNAPDKFNLHGYSGLEALTGKSNFDISEWMLIKIAEQITNTKSAMAFIIKTSVARKIFFYVEKHKLLIKNMYLREIDSKKHFNVSVDACLFYAEGAEQMPEEYKCPIFCDLKSESPYKIMGITNNKLVADMKMYQNLSDIDSSCEFKWRSGIKHDATHIMEFQETEKGFVNGLGELANLPIDYLYPMYKSSNISKEILKKPMKWMLVTQEKIGNETKDIKKISPKTWNYLQKYSNVLDSRKSSIYKNSPRFAIFGVGAYTFKPWKIVISGLYKNLHFSKIGTFKGKPIVLDDTCYMLGFDNEEETDFILMLLRSDYAKDFISSLVFKDNKRPITVTLLNRINLLSISKRLHVENDFNKYFSEKVSQLAFL